MAVRDKKVVFGGAGQARLGNAVAHARGDRGQGAGAAWLRGQHRRTVFGINNPRMIADGAVDFGGGFAQRVRWAYEGIHDYANDPPPRGYAPDSTDRSVRSGDFDVIIDNVYAAYTPEAQHWWEASILFNLRFLPLPAGLIDRICTELGGSPGAGRPHSPIIVRQRHMRETKELLR